MNCFVLFLFELTRHAFLNVFFVSKILPQRLKTAMISTVDLDAEGPLPEKQNLDNPASETLFTSVA